MPSFCDAKGWGIDDEGYMTPCLKQTILELLPPLFLFMFGCIRVNRLWHLGRNFQLLPLTNENRRSNPLFRGKCYATMCLCAMPLIYMFIDMANDNRDKISFARVLSAFAQTGSYVYSLTVLGAESRFAQAHNWVLIFWWVGAWAVNSTIFVMHENSFIRTGADDEEDVIVEYNIVGMVQFILGLALAALGIYGQEARDFDFDMLSEYSDESEYSSGGDLRQMTLLDRLFVFGTFWTYENHSLDDDGDVVLHPTWDNFDRYAKVPTRRLSLDRKPHTFKETKLWELWQKMSGKDEAASPRVQGSGSMQGMELQGKHIFDDFYDDNASTTSESSHGSVGVEAKYIPSLEECIVQVPGWSFPQEGGDSSTGTDSESDDEDAAPLDVEYDVQFLLPVGPAKSWPPLRLPAEISGIEEVQIENETRYKWTMSRRAGEFYRLDAALKRRFPGEYDRLPKLQRGMHSTGASLEERAQVLAVYLQCIVASPEMHCPELVKFCYPKFDAVQSGVSLGVGAGVVVGEEALERPGSTTTLDTISMMPLSRMADRFEYLNTTTPMGGEKESSCMVSDDDSSDDENSGLRDSQLCVDLASEIAVYPPSSNGQQEVSSPDLQDVDQFGLEVSSGPRCQPLSALNRVVNPVHLAGRLPRDKFQMFPYRLCSFPCCIEGSDLAHLMIETKEAKDKDEVKKLVGLMLDNRMMVNVLGVQNGVTVQTSNVFRHAPQETWLYANVRLVKNLAELKPVLLHNCFACIRDWQEGYENGSNRANFVVFKIEVNTDNDSFDVLRRYSDFRALDKILQEHWPSNKGDMPPFPTNTGGLLQDRFDPRFLRERKDALDLYLRDVLMMAYAQQTAIAPHVTSFLDPESYNVWKTSKLRDPATLYFDEM